MLEKYKGLKPSELRFKLKGKKRKFVERGQKIKATKNKIHGLEQAIEKMKREGKQKEEAQDTLVMEIKSIEELLSESKNENQRIIISDKAKLAYANTFFADITIEILKNLDSNKLVDGKNEVVFNGEEVVVYMKNNTIDHIARKTTGETK